MAFDGKEGSMIDKTVAAPMTKAWRTKYPNSTRSVFLGQEKLNQLLAPADAMGIRFYFALDANGKETVVAVAAQASQDDKLDKILDQSKQDPPYSSGPNVLNS